MDSQNVIVVGRSVARGKAPDSVPVAADVARCLSIPSWFALHSRPRHEKRIAERLKLKGFDVLLPLIRRTCVHARRRVEVHAPLFPCYLFVRSEADRVQEAAWTPGVIRILGDGMGRYTPVSRQEIERIRFAMGSGLEMAAHPYLKEGQAVRVKRGPLRGLEGILLQKNRHHRLVISVSLIARSASLAIHADDVEAI